MIVRARQILAFPFYFVAFFLHLLTAFFSVIAQKIAGDGTVPPAGDRQLTSDMRDMIISAMVAIAVLGGIFGILLLPTQLVPPRETSDARLEPVKPMKNEEFTKADFTSDRLKFVLPNLRLIACIYSEKALRHYIGPVFITLPSCGSHDFQVAISDNLIDITVSGLATIDNTSHPFAVTMQHNPPSVSEDGLIITSIEVSDAINIAKRHP